jgi:site-specific recombinase XerD
MGGELALVTAAAERMENGAAGAVEGVPLRLPVLIVAAGQEAEQRFLEFFLAQIRNPHTRAAYLRGILHLLDWCAAAGLRLQEVRPLHVGAWMEALERAGFAKATRKQWLAAGRKLFDWLAVGGLLPHNPAACVSGPKEVVRRIKTYVPEPEEARRLFDAIDTSRAVGLRDRALLGTLLYAFARVSAAAAMRVEDYYPRGKRWWLRLHEKGGKVHDVPAHHQLEEWMDAYLAATDLRERPQGPLFPSLDHKTKLLSQRPLLRGEVYDMIRRRAHAAGLGGSKITCHSFRGYGITAFMRNGGSIDKAQQIAAHASPETTKLYDCSDDPITLTEIERVII